MSHTHRIATIEPVLVEVPMKAPTHGVHGTVSTQRSASPRATIGARRMSSSSLALRSSQSP